MIRNVLVLDSDDDELHTLTETFREVVGESCLMHSVPSGEQLLYSVQAAFPYHLVLVEYRRADGGRSCLDLLRAIRDIDRDLPVVAVAEHGDVDTAERVMAAGANDFLVCGPRLQDRVTTLLRKVRHLVNLIEHKQKLEEENRVLAGAEHNSCEILGDSPQVRELLAKVQRVAQIPRPVLLLGERGTGKELVARAIHAAAFRGAALRGDSHPMVAVNCAAFPDALLESELFGHERGAFTSADRRLRGKFELADGGTLFLDEIGSMSLAFQQKILRTVEYGVFTRMGGQVEVHTSARIIAATNAELDAKIASGEFLPDLYDRLAFEVIRLPPLRDRPSDVEVLARTFLHRFMVEMPELRGKILSQRALEALRSYSFPGNVRELKTLIERAAYRDTTNEITPEDLSLPAAGSGVAATGSFHDRVEGFKKTLVFDALDEAAGNQAAAARALGLSYHQFRYFLGKYS